MQDILTSIKAYLYERSVSPLIGALLVSWSAWNYRFYVVLFSESSASPTDKFREIDLLFSPHLFSIWDVSFSINGKITDGALIPAFMAFIYLYAYPFLAKPVYEHSLKKQKELRAIKQEQDNQRLLSGEESREIYRRLAMMQSKHQEEVDGLNNQISALNQHIEELEKTRNVTREPKNEEPESNLEPVGEEELIAYNDHIHKAIENRGIGNFHLNELFGQKQWSDIPVAVRQALGKRFRQRVERGDFVGVTASGKSSGNQQKYFKSSSA